VGGGGRVAVWSVRRMFTGTASATNGVNTGSIYGMDGVQAGTIFWGAIPEAGTIISIH